MDVRRLLAGGLFGLCLALVGCSGGGGGAANPAPAIAPTTSVGPLLGTFPLGQKAALPDGDSVQVYAYSAAITPSNPYSQARPGSAFSVLDVEACSGPSPTPGGLLNPFFFSLELPDKSTIPAGIPVKDPALNVNALAPGACSRGFVTFEVPTGVTPATVVYGIPSVSIRWKVA